MNKRACASIIRLKPCTRTDVHRSPPPPSASPPPRSLVCTFMHTNIRFRWSLLCVVVQYDWKEPQIKFPLGASVSVSCPFVIRFTAVDCCSFNFSPFFYYVLRF